MFYILILVVVHKHLHLSKLIGLYVIRVNFTLCKLYINKLDCKNKGKEKTLKNTQREVIYR